MTVAGIRNTHHRESATRRFLPSPKPRSPGVRPLTWSKTMLSGCFIQDAAVFRSCERMGPQRFRDVTRRSPSAEQRIDERRWLEWCEIVGTLTEAHEFHRHAKVLLHTK